VIEMKIDKERRKFLERLAEKIMSEMMSKGVTSYEPVSDEVWDDAFLEILHPLLDEAIAEYKLGAHDIFYMGAWFGSQRSSINIL
jgi:fructose-1,6-bisphosphatase